MTTPPPTARPSASTITDDQLDQLHAELAEARAEAEQLHADIRAAAETIRHLEAGLTHAEAARDRHSRDAQLWVDAATGAERVRQMAERDRDEARAALEQERHVSSARGRYLAEVDAALIAAGQDEGGGYIAYARRISQLAADLDALRRQAADADAVTAQTKRLMAVRTETLRRRAERAEAEQNRLAITRGQVWWQLRVSEDAVQRARDLHQRCGCEIIDHCHECDRAWPCPTSSALDGPAPAAGPRQATPAAASTTRQATADTGRVQGRCPACGGESLFLASEGYVTCARLDCPEPAAASTLLEHPAAAVQRMPEREVHAAIRKMARADPAWAREVADRANRAAESDNLAAALSSAAEPQDTCRTVTIGGGPVHVRGAGEMTEQDRAYFAEVIRAAKRRYAAEHPAAAASQPTPCSEPDPCEDGNLCARHEVEQAHADGDHSICGPTCEVEFPSDQLRNAILARAIPGSARMLDELLRRAAERDPSCCLPGCLHRPTPEETS